MNQQPRVMIVEDNELTRSALAAALEEDGYLVRAVADGVGIERLVEEFRPDLALLDVELPYGPDGYVIARRLRGVSDLPILFLSGADGEPARIAGFEAGADDFVVKPFSTRELLARARALLRRSGRLASAVWQLADLVVDEGGRKVLRTGHSIDLTPTEYEMLVILVRQPGKVVSKEQLVQRLWGSDAGVSHLVNVHMSTLRRKLEEHGPRLIHTVRGTGFVIRA